MKTFKCTCPGQPVLFFENTSCIACGRVTGFTDEFKHLRPFNFDKETGYFTLAEYADKFYKKCHNFAHHQACNGMVEVDITAEKTAGDKPVPDKAASDKAANDEAATDEAVTNEAAKAGTLVEDEQLCFACQFNSLIPDLSVEGHLPLWRKMEVAKRRALYTLNALPVPLINAQKDPQSGLSFDFTTDRDVSDHFSSTIEEMPAVMTGHDSGHITINIAEANDVSRSKTRLAMGERYRTLLGHFRHELGHYYFDQLVFGQPGKHELCKRYFGDDQLDYQEALDKHYQEGAPKNWSEHYISEYATMHPYEDWAETWAHYMHIIDTLETAKSYGLTLLDNNSTDNSSEVNELKLPQNQGYFYFQTEFNTVLDTWVAFSIMLNSLNRSMGLQDAYPFVLTQAVRNKLMFVHHAIHNKLGNLEVEAMHEA